MSHKKKKKGTGHGTDFLNPEYFIDRELSWLAFNDRVIEEAEDGTTPLLERLKFLGIAASNLDEFFMVRVSGIQEQVQAVVRGTNTAGYSPQEQFERIHLRAQQQVARMYDCLGKRLLPKMESEGIHVRKFTDLKRAQKLFVREFFDREVFPVLTPLGVDSGHPFPHLRNLSLNLAVRLSSPENGKSGKLFAVVQVPTVLSRLVKLPSRENVHEFLLLEDLISEEIKLLFPGMKVREVCAFRVTRDADIEFAEDEADDLLKTVEEELRMRERGSAVRLSVEKRGSPELVDLLKKTIGLPDMCIYKIDGPINLTEVADIASHVDRRELKYPPFTPAVRPPFRGSENLFESVARQDVLIHHPFESFSTIVDFIQQAARDPNVLAIKQTMYRTSGDSKIIKALMEAAENGKQVAALMELKARFDEERNIEWARQMEKAGVHVVYGLVGLKTHAKLCLVVRKEQGGLRRYLHLGTGNYNPITARIYTDLSLLTCDPDLCDDAAELFNLLTGYSRLPHFGKMIVAPIQMRDFIKEMIAQEVEKARTGGAGRIRAKMNSLVDADIITELYLASCAGVKIELMVRGICCLRPGIPSVSENIEVSSIVDRFLEHSRLFIFGEGDEARVYLSSADWMPRNLDRRVETVFPIESDALKRRVIDEIWATSIGDNVKRRALKSDGTYARRGKSEGSAELRSQLRLLQIEEELRQETARHPGAAEMLTAHPGAKSAAQALVPVRPPKPGARGLKSMKDGAVKNLDGILPLHQSHDSREEHPLAPVMERIGETASPVESKKAE